MMRSGKYLAIIGLIFTVLLSSLSCSNEGSSRNDQLPQHDFKYKNPDGNVILITICSLRADHLSVYGYKRMTMPYLNNFSKEGIVFKNVISQASWTAPSLHSIFLSRNVLIDYDDDDDDDEDEEGEEEEEDEGGFKMNNSLMDVLKRNNFYTAAIIAQSGMPYMKNYFDYFDHIDVTQWTSPAEELAEKAVKWVENNKGRKFFLWLHFWDPHYNFLPPPPFNKTFDTEDYQGPLRKKKDIVEIRDLAEELSEEDIKYLISQYDGELRYTDEMVKKFFENLKNFASFNKTLIIIAADHGEEFGERQHFGHAIHLYDTMVRTPLIMINPASDLKNLSIKNLVRNLDIAPTILDVLDIQQPQSFEGVSLYKIISQDLKLPAFSKTYPPWEPKKLLSLKADGYKIIFQGQPEELFMTYRSNDFTGFVELYDMVKDPYEKSNIAKKHPRIVSNLIKKMRGLVKDSLLETPSQMDEKILKKYRDMGYF